MRGYHKCNTELDTELTNAAYSMGPIHLVPIFHRLALPANSSSACSFKLSCHIFLKTFSRLEKRFLLQGATRQNQNMSEQHRHIQSVHTCMQEAETNKKIISIKTCLLTFVFVGGDCYKLSVSNKTLAENAFNN